MSEVKSDALPSADAVKLTETKVEPTNNVDAGAWSPEKAKPILEKYQGKPDEIAKALHSQQTENAKARKELESLKAELTKYKAPKTEVTSSDAVKEELLPIKKDSLLKRAMQDLEDNDKISEELAKEIKDANNFTDDTEFNDWVSIAKGKTDAKYKEAQQYVKMNVKDVLKNAPNVLSDAELVALQVSLKAGVYDVLKHVERKLVGASKEKTTVSHGSVGKTNPGAEAGFGSMDEYDKMMKDPNRGTDEHSRMMAAKTKATDWSKLRASMSMGSFRPKI